MREKPVNKLQIRKVRFVPEDIELTPSNPADLVVEEGVKLVLANLFGQADTGGCSIKATIWNALRVATYSSGYTEYDTLTGTAPAAYAALHTLTASAYYIHRWDFLIETAEAVVSFAHPVTGVFGDDIPLTVGNHSIELTAGACRIKKRGLAAGTYSIVGCW